MFLTAELSSPEQRVVSKVRQDVNVYADGSYALETQLRLENATRLVDARANRASP